MNCPKALLSWGYPASPRPPRRDQPAQAGCMAATGGCDGEGVAELANRGCSVGPSVAVPVETARHAGRLPRLGKRVDPVD
jgi:hypothetical protein